MSKTPKPKAGTKREPKRDRSLSAEEVEMFLELSKLKEQQMQLRQDRISSNQNNQAEDGTKDE